MVLQRSVLALVLISPFINIMDDGRESMFIKCPDDTTHGGAISTSEERIRVQSYLEELKKQSGK